MLLLAAASCGRPPLQVTEREGNYFIDVQQLGEYVSTVNRLQVKDRDQVIWEIRAKGDAAQFGYLTLRVGTNPASVGPVYYGEYVTVCPKADVFELKPDQDYEVWAWGTNTWWPSRATFRTHGAAVEPHAAS